MFEEENINPRPRTQRYLANVLNSHGREVPFDVPEKTTQVSRGAEGLIRSFGIWLIVYTYYFGSTGAVYVDVQWSIGEYIHSNDNIL